MKNIISIIFILMVIIVIRLKKCENIGDAFTKETTIILKGVAAITVLFHHLALEYTEGIFFVFFLQ